MPCVQQSQLTANSRIRGGPYDSYDDCVQSNCPSCTVVVSYLSQYSSWGRSVDGCSSIPNNERLIISNTIGFPALLMASGYVDDDLLINGSVYEPDSYTRDWTGCNKCGSGGNNGPHYWSYAEVLQTGESITFGARDNGRCIETDNIDGTLSVNWELHACVTPVCYRFTEWSTGPGDNSPGACCGGGSNPVLITGPSWANQVRITGTYGDQLEFSGATQRCYGYMIPPGITCDKGVREIDLTLNKGSFPYDSNSFYLRYIYNGGTTIGYDINVCFDIAQT